MNHPETSSAWPGVAGQGHDWIAARVPHQGTMCLLDRVLNASPDAIRCAATSHRAAHHPMRQHGRLGAACGVEYAAQAMALHGALQAEQRGLPRPRRGLLVSVRGVTLHVARLDDVAGEITVMAQCEAESVDLCQYAFALHAGERPLVEGRATVMLDVSGPDSP
ncbi:3-hydroxylacyl-ACP dehydratase [Ottowia testudinis]|uniref:3-hydroxylacyl-ACP dehydratase n=1 Tax=Ottowia testudinis TaxID=2816950 RepID=A0A975H4A2_9BURK|nr:3-hydroxylacyl-ACP dehydratase [Ottowia testudinis]QTD43697.1 3-hydroxylacyl-ACP dehydratase [Ottowia testudinis]